MATFTWHGTAPPFPPGLPVDPSPTTVKALNTGAGATWSCSNQTGSNNWDATGSASNGVGTYQANNPSRSGGSVSGGAKYVDKGVTQDQFVVSYSVSGYMSGSSTDGSTLNGKVILGLSTKVHAHPYLFDRQSSNNALGAGKLQVTYAWKSTSGSLSDIVTDANGFPSTVYEHLDYVDGDPPAPAGGAGMDGSRVTYLPSRPPFSNAWAPKNPTDPFTYPLDRPAGPFGGAVWKDARIGSLTDTHTGMPADNPTFLRNGQGNYIYGSYKANQQYRFYCVDVDCPDHMQPRAVVGRNINNTITRKLTPNANPTSATYECSKPFVNDQDGGVDIAQLLNINQL
jgi:hypothetical protein